MLGKQFGQPVVVPVAADGVQGLQQGQIWLALPIKFNALAEGDDRSGHALALGKEAVEKDGLADAGFAGDENDLPRAPKASFEAGVQCGALAFPADQPWSGRFANLRHGCTRSGGLDGCDWGDEAVTAAGNCLDEGGRRRIVTQYLS